MNSECVDPTRRDDLEEPPHGRQISGEPRRRWFTSRKLDLIVWYSDADRIIGFQVCYYRGVNRYALTWMEDSGYRHNRIDEGEGRPGGHKMTPILVPDGTFDGDDVLALFDKSSLKIDQHTREIVRERLVSA